MLSDEQIIEVFKALADPNRLRLFELLLQSDQTNSELIVTTGLRQNLLSHHLNVLMSCGLVQGHRSIGDARRYYYSVNFRITCQMRQWWGIKTPECYPASMMLRQPQRVLFLCLHNATRSLFAEIIARHLFSGALIPYSAGLQEANTPLPPVALQVLAERNLPAHPLIQKNYTSLVGQAFDYVITVCDVVHEHDLVPELAQARCLHWSLVDPLDSAHDQAGQLTAARTLFEELTLRIAFFVQRLAYEEIPVKVT
ncbi:MAG: metalloregulator ArsR/SmtB family transcription factor [Chloroflexi bacterium]|nr:metalloregulator ArsR/SmtB family transcription factor [Chloroflexota bacterium]